MQSSGVKAQVRGKAREMNALGASGLNEDHASGAPHTLYKSILRAALSRACKGGGMAPIGRLSLF
jgi:hypothetical protein